MAATAADGDEVASLVATPEGARALERPRPHDRRAGGRRAAPGAGGAAGAGRPRASTWRCSPTCRRGWTPCPILLAVHDATFMTNPEWLGARARMVLRGLVPRVGADGAAGAGPVRDRGRATWPTALRIDPAKVRVVSPHPAPVVHARGGRRRAGARSASALERYVPGGGRPGAAEEPGRAGRGGAAGMGRTGRPGARAGRQARARAASGSRPRRAGAGWARVRRRAGRPLPRRRGDGVPLALRGLRAAGGRGDGLRLPGGGERPRRDPGGGGRRGDPGGAVAARHRRGPAARRSTPRRPPACAPPDRRGRPATPRRGWARAAWAAAREAAGEDRDGRHARHPGRLQRLRDRRRAPGGALHGPRPRGDGLLPPPHDRAPARRTPARAWCTCRRSAASTSTRSPTPW